ncbi:MAG: DUF1349 domain-containing protein [Planctomycetota bacterium]
MATTILVVSDSKVPGVDPTEIHEDDELVQFLEDLGFTVDTDGMAQEGQNNGNYREGGRSPWAAGNESKLQHLQDADLIIVSRRPSSGSYDNDRSNWNTLETPLILMSGYFTRGGGDNRWHWTNGGSGNTGNTVTDIEIEAGQEDHPFLTGLTGPITVFDWSTSPGGICPKGVYLPGDDFMAGTTLIGRFDGRPMLADIPAGTTFANGDVAGERRVFLGHWGYDIDLAAPYDREANFDDFITDDYKTLLMNIINEILGIVSETARSPNPGNGATVQLAEATPLSWTAGESAVKHDVYLGTTFDDVNDADSSDTTGIYRGQEILPIFTPTEDLELGQNYYWRIDEVETDNTTVHRGNVWSFTVAAYLLIDDMEDYNYDDNLIWHVWKDGEGWPEPPPGWGGNGSGSVMDIGIDVAQDAQSLMYSYDNGGTNSLGTTGKAFYSEAKMTLSSGRDWTAQGVRALSLSFIGYPEDVGGFIEAPAGTYTMTAAGADIWSDSDEFHFAFKELNGAGTIIAKVESVENTDGFAKAGVMIRDSLDPNSANAALLITPENGVRFQHRDITDGNTVRDFNDTVIAPQWVKLIRDLGGRVRAAYSADGIDWTEMDPVTTVTMNLPMYVGLALTSHDADAKCVAEFSNVSFPDTTVGAEWTHQDLGIISNDAEPMYVAISNNNGTTRTVYYEDNDNKDPNATLIDTWTEWNIDLKDFSDQGVDLTDVNGIAIGFGDRDNPQAGGSGKMYFDNIRLYQPRCILDKVTLLEGDLTGDCVVDFRDLEMMADDWLLTEVVEPIWDGIFTSQDIGATTAEGSFDFDGSVYTILADGADIWSTSDAFHYAFQQVSGDFQMTVRVTSVDAVHDFVKAGIMARSSLDPSAPNVLVAITGGGGNGATFQWRYTQNGSSTSSRTLAGISPPSCIRLVRSGDTFTGYVFLDNHWRQEGQSTTVVMTDPIYLGLAVTSHVAGTLTTATFDRSCVFSVADMYDDKKINFKDLAFLAEDWLEPKLWPEL